MATPIDFVPYEGNYRFSATLPTDEGSGIYTFDVRWNTRDEAWRFDMYDPDGILMVAGVKIVLNTPLGRRSAHPFFNNNTIRAVDTSLSNLDPGFDDIGYRVQIWHYTTSDIAALMLVV
jgi:hypothetical protein